MARFYDDGSVVCDTLTWDFYPGEVLLYGEIACRGRIVINVEKLLRVIEYNDDEPIVQTVRYAYNASVRGFDNFLRHDNLHARPGHPDSHHRHDFNWKNGRERKGSPRWVGAAGWPTLGDFIIEVDNWYWSNSDDLPEGVATLDAPSHRELRNASARLEDE